MTNFSILGFGHIGRVHYEAIKETEDANLIAIVDLHKPDIDEEEQAKCYDTLEEFLLQDTQTDVVVIATPNGLHTEHAIRCLKAGKHVLIEKPMALNVDDALQILQISNTYNRRVFSSMQLRFSPVVQFVKNLIDQHALGKIYMVNIQCYWNRNKNYYKQREWHGSETMDGGVLFTQFSHFIDIMNYWFDEVVCQQSQQFNFNHQDVTEFADSGKLDFVADGAIGSMTYTTSVFNKNFESHITLIAEKGTVKIGDQYLNKLLYADMKNVCCSEKISTEQKNFHPNAINEICETLSENRQSILDGAHAVNLVKFIADANTLAKQQLYFSN